MQKIVGTGLPKLVMLCKFLTLYNLKPIRFKFSLAFKIYRGMWIHYSKYSWKWTNLHSASSLIKPSIWAVCSECSGVLAGSRELCHLRAAAPTAQHLSGPGQDWGRHLAAQLAAGTWPCRAKSNKGRLLVLACNLVMGTVWLVVRKANLLN